jgi:hypothetical protein
MPFVKLLPSVPGQKGETVTLANHTIKGEDPFRPVVQIADDPYCLYNLLDRLKNQMLPPDASEGRILRRMAPKKQIEKWRDEGASYLLDHRAAGVIGSNQPNLLLKELAHICGYDDPDNCTAQGMRKAGISALANSSDCIASRAVMTAARHRNANTSTTVSVDVVILVRLSRKLHIITCFFFSIRNQTR